MLKTHSHKHQCGVQKRQHLKKAPIRKDKVLNIQKRQFFGLFSSKKDEDDDESITSGEEFLDPRLIPIPSEELNFDQYQNVDFLPLSSTEKIQPTLQQFFPTMHDMNQYTDGTAQHNPYSHQKWLYNFQTGIHPSYPLFLHRDASQLYMLNPFSSTKPLVRLRDMQYDPKAFDKPYNHMIHNESALEYYQPNFAGDGQLQDRFSFHYKCLDYTGEERNLTTRPPRQNAENVYQEDEHGEETYVEIQEKTTVKHVPPKKRGTLFTSRPAQFSTIPEGAFSISDPSLLNYRRGGSKRIIGGLLSNMSGMAGLLMQEKPDLVDFIPDVTPSSKTETNAIFPKNPLIIRNAEHTQHSVIFSDTRFLDTIIHENHHNNQIHPDDTNSVHVKLRYKVSQAHLIAFNELAHNTNKLTQEGDSYHHAVIPHDLMASVALDALYAVNDMTTPIAPPIVQSVMNLWPQHINQISTASFLAQEMMPKFNAQEQADYFNLMQQRVADLPQWSNIFQSLIGVDYKSHRPILFPNQKTYDQINQNVQNYASLQPHVYLTFNAIIEDQMDAGADYYAKIDEKVQYANEIVRKHHEKLNSDQNPHKRLAIRRNMNDEIMMQSLSDVNLQKIQDVSGKNAQQNQVLQQKVQFDNTTNIYLNGDGILDDIVQLKDVGRPADKYCHVRFWFNIQYDPQLLDSDPVIAENYDLYEQVFSGSATFGAPHIQTSWGKEERFFTTKLFSYVQGVDISREQDVMNGLFM